VTGRARYGDLLRDASSHLLRGTVILARDRFDDTAAAQAAIAAHQDLLHGLGRLARELLGADLRAPGPRRSAERDPRRAASVRLVDELDAFGRVRSWEAGAPPAGVAAAWGAAATAVRAAGDLLATHRDGGGGWRNPHAALLDDPTVRAVGLAQVAALVVPLAQTTEQLGLRSGQAGVPWTQVQRQLPPTGVLAQLATQVRAAAAGAPTGQAMAQIEVARPAIREGEPLVELGDRLARLHRVAWQLTREPNVGAATLTDFAAAGLLVHEAAAQTLHRFMGSAQDQTLDPRLRDNVETVNRSGAAWQRIHLTLRSLRTATPALAVVRGDLIAARRLLGDVTRADSGIQATRALPVLLGAVGSHVDVAGWNAQALHRVAGTGQAHLQGKTLPRDLVSDRPDLVDAKLRNLLTPAPQAALGDLRDAYIAARCAAGIPPVPTPAAQAAGRSVQVQ